MARPEGLIPRFARHPVGAHFVRLSARKLASVDRRLGRLTQVGTTHLSRQSEHNLYVPLLFSCRLSGVPDYARKLPGPDVFAAHNHDEVGGSPL